MSVLAPDLRGQIYREKRLMKPDETAEFLRRQKIANVGTVDRKWLALCGAPGLYLRRRRPALSSYRRPQGHFLTNVQNHPRICVEVSEIGDLRRGKPYACDSALVYTSVIPFSPATVPHGPESREKKTWFLDRHMTKYGKPERTFEPGYPSIDRIILYELKIEVVTGKHSNGLYH